MINLLSIFNDLIHHAAILFGLGIGFLFLYYVSFDNFAFSYIEVLLKREINKKNFRIFLISLLVLIGTTIVYLLVDSYFYDLPDPVIPYIFYILVTTVAFGIEIGIITGLLSFLLIDYYLFSPTYTFIVNKNSVSIISGLIGLNIALLIGTMIRNRQQKLEKETLNLRSSIIARERFTASIVHDLKNPITTIKLYTRLLDNKDTSIKNNSMLLKSAETIKKESDRLLSMVDQLLDYSKLQNNKFIIQKEYFDLHKLCEDRIKIMQTTYPNYKFEFCSAHNNANILADKNAIDRVISNLLINAVKYSSEKSTVSLEIKNTKDNYIIAIKDQGEGISEDKQSLIFEPFYQPENSQFGLGMGLYIVKSIIELHKGKIVLESKLKKGSTFWISLPRAMLN